VCTRVSCVEQSENIKLDPELHAACKDDVSKLCDKTHAGNAAVSVHTSYVNKQRRHNLCSELDNLKNMMTFSDKLENLMNFCVTGLPLIMETT